MATTTNYGWTTPDDTALVKDGASAIRTLGTSIDTTTKNLNPSTTLGDIEYRSSSANTNTRLGIGSTGQVLTVSGGVPSWATPAAGGGMTLLSTTATTSGTSITVSGISGSYKDLLVSFEGINRTSTSSIRITPRVGTTDIDCFYSTIFNDGVSRSAYLYIHPDNNTGQVATGNPANFVLYISNYASTSYKKPFNFYGAFQRSSTNSLWSTAAQGVIDTNSAINAINMYADYAFNAGQIKIYGVN